MSTSSLATNTPMAVKIDPILIPYTTTNDPLPSELRPICDMYLEEVKMHVVAYNTLIDQIEAKMLEQEGKVGGVEKDVEALQAQLQQAKEVKDEHQTVVRALTGTTSIIRRIPPEIIASVIAHSMESGLWWWDSARGQRLCTASSVSRFWRRTALSTPSLWRRLVVDVAKISRRRKDQDALEILTRTLDTWFSRGGEGAGMDLSLYAMNMEPKTRHALAAGLIRWFNTSNVSFLSLHVDNFFSKLELKSLLGSNADCFRSMRTLTLQPSANWTYGSAPESINIEVALPNLRSLTLIACNGSFSLPFFRHPSLTKLDLAEASYHSSIILSALRSLPNLEWLVLRCDIQLNREGAPFTHNSLRRITGTASNTIMGTFLGSVSCPLLERFDIWDMPSRGWDADGEALDAAQRIGALIQRSLLSTFTLSLHGPFPAAILNTLLSTSNPKVTTLDLYSLTDLPLDPTKNTTQLIVPSSVNHIHCSSKWLGDERDLEVVLSTLSLCLEEANDCTLAVKIGDESAVKYVKDSLISADAHNSLGALKKV
jgi:F-box-like